MSSRPWEIARGTDPLVATAIHAGHELRPEVEAIMKLPEADRLREEDPFTDRWLGAAANTIAVSRSRFEVDLNRPRDKAVYREPADAWGLDIWQSPPPDDLVAGSLELYDAYYADLGAMCDEVIEEHGHVVVLDLHSYNHRRLGPDKAVDDPEANPEVNLGTESVAPAWRDVIDVFAEAMAAHPFDNGHLDVRENVRFKGGAMPRWVNARYGDTGCAIAIEAKKIYMDEWSGALDEGITVNIGEAISVAADAVRSALAARRAE